MGNHTFERIREKVNNYVNKGLHSKIGKEVITMNLVKHFLQNIISGKFNDEKEVKKIYVNNAYKGEQEISRLDNKTNCNKDMIDIYDQVRKIFTAPSEPDVKYVPTYDKSDYKADNEQPDTTDMPKLESDESAKQRRKQKRQGLKILNPQQVLSKLPISLAQLKAGNNSGKRKNEIRQLLYSLYRSKKLSKTIYKHLMNATI